MFAAGIVAAASLTSYAIGWTPIPFSDAPLLIGTQVIMAAKLATLFGVNSEALIPVVAGQIAVYAGGLGLTSLLKLIPGIGTVIGGVIDSTVAIILTAALGIVYPNTFCHLFYFFCKTSLTLNIYTAFFGYVYKKTIHSTASDRSHFAVEAMKRLAIGPLMGRISTPYFLIQVSFFDKDR